MKLKTLVPLSLALALLSCAAPKKAVLLPAAPASPNNAAEEASKPTEPNLPNGPNDGIRMPDMLAMPGDGDFRPTVPPASKTGTESGAVIARPPTEPPSRPKTEDKEKEKTGQ